MSRFGTQYHVSRPTGRCAATGCALDPGSACIATLCERPDDEGFDRLDYSLEAWERGERPERLFSHWRTAVPEPGEKRHALVDDDVLEDLFERLADDDRPQRLAFRFVLGLVLLRKRRLRFVGRATDGQTPLWLLLPRKAAPEKPPIPVVDPRLTDDDVVELTDQLSEILQSELA